MLQAVRVKDRDLDAVDGPIDRAFGQVQAFSDLVDRAPAGAGGQDPLRFLVDVGDMLRRRMASSCSGATARPASALTPCVTT